MSNFRIAHADLPLMPWPEIDHYFPTPKNRLSRNARNYIIFKYAPVAQLDRAAVS